MNKMDRDVSPGGPDFARVAISAAAALLLVAGVGLYLNLPVFRWLWIWPDPDPVAMAFVGSWFASGSAAMLWVGLSGQLTALRPLLLTLLVAFGGVTWSLLAFAGRPLPGNERYQTFAVVLAVSMAVATAVLVWLRRQPVPVDRPVSAAIPGAFLFLSGFLLFVGVALVLGFTRVFPVPLRADVAAVCGWLFLGSTVYYVSAAVRPSRLNTVGQLVSFLVYDLLLIPPFVLLLPDVDPAHRLSLFVYLAVLVGTAAFCAYHLLVDPRTRLLPAVSRAPARA